MAIDVLIIDSEVKVAAGLRDFLVEHGISAIIADDPNGAIELARSQQPLFIVLAVELQRANGYSLCNRIKKDPAQSAIPLLLTSAQASDETFREHRRLKTHADAYLKKPYNYTQVLEIYQRLVRQRPEDTTD